MYVAKHTLHFSLLTAIIPKKKNPESNNSDYKVLLNRQNFISREKKGCEVLGFLRPSFFSDVMQLRLAAGTNTLS